MSWTQDQKNRLTEAITTMCAFYGKDLPDVAFKMYAKLLMDHPYELVMGAFQKCINDPTVRAMPAPAQLIALVKPLITEKDEARDVATILFRACRKHGDFWSAGVSINGRLVFDGENDYYNTFQEAATVVVGELGFEVIRRMGGWGAVYGMYNTTPDGVFMAQIRDLAETVSKKSASGTLREPPKLPKSIHEIENERRQTLNAQVKKLEGR